MAGTSDTPACLPCYPPAAFPCLASFQQKQFHDGLGFMTSHSLLTNTFEYSLQIVNPKLTVPYWDFTFESSTMGGNTEAITEPQANSPLFTSEWFGRNDPDDLQVKYGRIDRLTCEHFCFFLCMDDGSSIKQMRIVH